MYTKEDSVFVQIASYRDPELQHTLQDLFKKAKRPENIFVGICHQYDMQDDSENKNLFQIPFPRPNQIRIDEVDYKESKGCCWARNRVQKLWQNEKWTLMIDSHMRFEENWDETLVLQIKNLMENNITKPIISCYLNRYTLGGKLDTHLTPNMNCYWEKDIPRNGGIPSLEPIKYNNGVLISAHFIFADANIINDTKYDPFLYFIGEEMSLAVRLWTSGYTIVKPAKSIIYHLYTDNENNTERNYRLRHDDSYEKNKNSFLRLKHLLNIKKSSDLNDEYLTDLEKYSLGTKRSLKDYERLSGIDFRKQKVREHTKKGIFEDWQEVSSIEEIKTLFSNIPN